MQEVLTRRPVAITAGDPAGVGPELCLHLLSRPDETPLVVVGDREILAERAKQTGAPFAADDFESAPESRRAVLHCPLDAPVVLGKPSAANARHVLRQLDIAAEGCIAGRFRATVSAPVCKSAVCDAGIPFTGVTEYLARAAKVSRAVMLMESPKLRVALATMHIPLAEVPRAITRAGLVETLAILDSELRAKFTNGRAPTIKVAGLNPHAGEDGHCGREEIETIAPAIAEARKTGVAAEGPFPADTIFVGDDSQKADCVLAMYHDQALPVFKRADFDGGVNATLGLPFVRVSPDHGVAADIAGSGRVRPNSMRAALDLALRMSAADENNPAQKQ